MIIYPVIFPCNLGLTVANIKSAIKRVQTSERNRLRNKSYRSAVKTLSKRVLAAVDTYGTSPTDENKQAAEARLSAAYSKIDKAVKRGALHPNAGARRKAGLARTFKQKALAQQSSTAS